jgi:soluble lytic murein transglycosylase
MSTVVPGAQPPNAPLIRALLSAGLYDDAVNEVRLVERASGPSPLLDATLAYALNRKGELRPAIQTMRRAYPQFLAEGGEALPSDLLAVIFPVAYWDLIRKYAEAHKLDPYLMAALIAQESTFDAGVKSSANAWGLMQILPSTGKEYARKLGITPFRTARLTEPEVNIRIGMAVFADLVTDLGDLSLALAAYNAGEDRAEHWKAARLGVERDVFIDDIPYAETQNYVKRILGTAEDYRLLYQTGKASPITTHGK